MHDTKWTGHLGEERTLALLARSFHWPKMKEDMQAYVQSCHVYQVDKIEWKKEADLLSWRDHGSAYLWTSSMGSQRLRASDSCFGCGGHVPSSYQS